MPSVFELNNPALLRGPNFLIIGVQKSATTTLFNVLDQMKGFSGSLQKEIHFFDGDHNYKKGVDWYLNCFKADCRGVRFEASPSYLYSQQAPRRIFETFGAMKFVVMLRDPVKRCFSAWNMFRNFNADDVVAAHIYESFVKSLNVGSRENLYSLLFAKYFPGFDRCVSEDIDRYRRGVKVEEPSFVRRGFYHDQIARYLDYFSIHDFLFLEHDDFSENIVNSIMRVQDFLGVKIDIDASVVQRRVHSNKGEYAGVDIKEYKDVLFRLYDLYHDHNENLFSLVGERYSWSSDWVTM